VFLRAAVVIGLKCSLRHDQFLRGRPILSPGAIVRGVT
jgi:hypothetical protein